MTGATLCVATLAGLGAPAVPEPERESNPHYVRAKEAYDAEDWQAAAAHFEAAHALDPRPEYLYAEGQAHRLGGHCPKAVEAYRSFIATEPPAAAIEDAKRNIEACDGELEESHPADPAGRETAARRPPPPPEPGPRSAVDNPPAPERPRSKLWYRDPLGGALTFGGLAVAIAGATLVGIAHARKRRAETTMTEQQYLDEFRGAPTASRVGLGLLGAGAIVLTGGVVRYAVLAARARRRTRSATASKR